MSCDLFRHVFIFLDLFYIHWNLRTERYNKFTIGSKRMAERHIVLPSTFKDGDIDEWLQKFEICANANGWDETTQARKLPTLLDGEALMTFLEMPEDDKKDFTKIFTALKNEFPPEESRFKSLREFETRKQLPGASPHVFLFILKKLLNKALTRRLKRIYYFTIFLTVCLII